MNRSESNSSLSRINSKSKLGRVKPRFYKQFSMIVKEYFDDVLDYLTLEELINLRSTNQALFATVHDYFSKRIIIENETIKSFQESNSLLINEFLKHIEDQIPMSTDNWLEYDIKIIIQNLGLFDKRILNSLRSLKSISKGLTDKVFAPFCIIMGFNSVSFLSIRNQIQKLEQKDGLKLL